MAPAKSVALVCLAILAVSSAALGASAADAPDAPSTRPAAAAAEKLGLLSNPLGSGLNSPLSLGRTPKYGRRFLNLMQQLIGAARRGDLGLAQQIQQQLFYVTRLRGHRRHLLQSMCPAVTNPLTPETAAEAAAKRAAATAPTAKNTDTNGPLPAIRFATMQPCANWLCQKAFALVKQADGTVACQRTQRTDLGQTQGASTRQVELPGAIEVEDFAYFQVYDYDQLWDTDGDNVVASAYAGTNTAQANSIDTARGSLSASSTLETDTQVRVQPNPFLAVRGDTLVGSTFGTGVEVSRDVGDEATLTFATDVVPFAASGNFGAVVPGTIVTERGADDEDFEPSDDNVAIRVTNFPALFGFVGKKR